MPHRTRNLSSAFTDYQQIGAERKEKENRKKEEEGNEKARHKMREMDKDLTAKNIDLRDNLFAYIKVVINFAELK